MRAFEADFDGIIELGEQMEDSVKDRIKQRIRAGVSAAEILSTESTWADMAMELKTTIAFSRIANRGVCPEPGGRGPAGD